MGKKGGGFARGGVCVWVMGKGGGAGCCGRREQGDGLGGRGHLVYKAGLVSPVCDLLLGSCVLDKSSLYSAVLYSSTLVSPGPDAPTYSQSKSLQSATDLSAGDLELSPSISIPLLGCVYWTFPRLLGPYLGREIIDHQAHTR